MKLYQIDVDGLYIGGGFPEEFAEELAEQREVKHSIKSAIEKGLPTLAECGGFMFLTESIETTDEKNYEMVGIIPGKVKMQTEAGCFRISRNNSGKRKFLIRWGSDSQRT